MLGYLCQTKFDFNTERTKSKLKGNQTTEMHQTPEEESPIVVAALDTGLRLLRAGGALSREGAGARKA